MLVFHPKAAQHQTLLIILAQLEVLISYEQLTFAGVLNLEVEESVFAEVGDVYISLGVSDCGDAGSAPGVGKWIFEGLIRVEIIRVRQVHELPNPIIIPLLIEVVGVDRK